MSGGGYTLSSLAEGKIEQLREWMLFIGGDDLRDHPEYAPNDVQLLYMALEFTVSVIMLDPVLKKDLQEHVRELGSLVASGVLDKSFVGYDDADYKYMPHALRDEPRAFYQKNLDYIVSFLSYGKDRFKDA